MIVVKLSEIDIPEITDVLCEAFYNYPVMKYVLGEKDDYDLRLRKIVEFFVSARVFRKDPLFGIYNDDKKLIASATVTLPGDIPMPGEFFKRREIFWAEIGEAEQIRYDRYGKAAFGLLPKEPHHHLNMIGVKKAYQGKGLDRQLINSVEELVSTHPTSTGVSLNTEVEANVNFYLHLGFELLGKSNVEENFVTWGFFKSKEKK